MDSTLSQALLSPRSVALVGVSGDGSKNTARPLLFMRKHGYRGKVFPINSSRDEILGQRAYPNLESLPAPVDHIFIMVAGQHVLDLLPACAAAGAKVVTIYSDGFAESGEDGVERQQELVRQARALNLRVLGPNSIGTANIHAGCILSVNAVFEAENLVPGSISMVSQSGSMMGSLLSRAAARGFGFAKTLSVGNESDISVGEVVNALVDDPQTETILLFLETIRDASVLGPALARARAANKPVVAYKLGRSEQGNELSQSHTGAIAGNDAAIDAFFRAHGVLRVHMLETLFEIVPLSHRYMAAAPILAHTPRVAVITTTGGGAATVVDNFGVRGIKAVAPPDDFIDLMAGRGLKLKKAPVIDLTLAATSQQYKDLVEHLLAASWCDAVLSVVGSSAQFHPSLAVGPLIEASKPADKPLVAFLAPNADESLAALQKNGIAAFRTPEGCADALAVFLGRAKVPDRAYKGQSASLVEWPEHIPTDGLLSEYEATQLLANLGIQVAQNALVPADDLRHDIPYPVVAKVCSRDIAHKTDVGGVRINIADDAALKHEVTAMLETVHRHAPDARIDGVLIQKMEPRLLELILGYRYDPLVGPTVILGAGGVAAELISDYSIRLAPVDLATAQEMITEVRSTQLVRGYRGLPQGDCDALARTIKAFSQLACLDAVHVAEAEINPLFVQQDGVTAVDALIRLERHLLCDDAPTSLFGKATHNKMEVEHTQAHTYTTSDQT